MMRLSFHYLAGDVVISLTPTYVVCVMVGVGGGLERSSQLAG